MDRIKYLLLPLAGLWLALLALYAFLAALVVPDRWFGEYTDLIAFSFPVLPAVLVLWLRPRLQLIDWKKGGEKAGRNLFPLIAVVLFVIHIGIVQIHIDKARSSLAEVQNASELADTAGRYFSVSSSYIDISQLKSAMVFRPPGRGHRREEIYVYIACPLRNSVADMSEPRVWLGIEYKKVVQLSDKIVSMETLCREFYRKCLLEFRASRGGQFTYLENIDGNDFVKQFQKGTIREGGGFPPGFGDMVYRPVYEPFESRNDDALSWIFGYYLFVVGVVILPIVVGANKERLRRYVADVREKREKQWNALRGVFREGEI